MATRWNRCPPIITFNFNEIYVVQETSTADLGQYQVIPLPCPPTVQVVRPSVLDFFVTCPGLCAISSVNPAG